MKKPLDPKLLELRDATHVTRCNDPGFENLPMWSDRPVRGLVDEAVSGSGPDGAHKPRWAIGHRQFDLIRTSDGVTYLTRWWLVATPFGGIALHKMQAPDARETLHDHPFTFFSIVLRGGYTERRLVPRTMGTRTRHVRRFNYMRCGIDAHSIRRLKRNPTWTLLFIGRQRRTWGFWESNRFDRGLWDWTKHNAFDSGHYAK